MGQELLLIGLDPGVLPAPAVVRETLGKTMTPGLSSGEAPNSDGAAGFRTLGVVDGPAMEPVSQSWLLNWSEHAGNEDAWV